MSNAPESGPESGPENVPESLNMAGSKPLPVMVGEIRGWIRDIFFVVGTAIMIVVFLYQPVKVEGTSMLPELKDQESHFQKLQLAPGRFIGHLLVGANLTSLPRPYVTAPAASVTFPK